MPKKGTYFVGEVGVDSGMILMIDPCYIKRMTNLHNDKDWSKFCEGITFEPQEIGGGLMTTNHIGDGGFPVYATYNSDGGVTKIEIRFHWTNDKDRDNEQCIKVARDLARAL